MQHVIGMATSAIKKKKNPHSTLYCQVRKGHTSSKGLQKGMQRNCFVPFHLPNWMTGDQA